MLELDARRLARPGDVWHARRGRSRAIYRGRGGRHEPPASGNLEALARACRSIEVEVGGEWKVLEDAAGPVTFDDRLTRLLGWERPGDEYRYAVREVYAAMFGQDGFAVMTHARLALTGLGLVNRGRSGRIYRLAARRRSRGRHRARGESDGARARRPRRSGAHDAALERAADYRLQLDKRLARLVVTELGEALKRGRRK